MKTLDWSVETLGRGRNSTWLCVRFQKTVVTSGSMTDIVPGCSERNNFIDVI